MLHWRLACMGGFEGPPEARGKQQAGDASPEDTSEGCSSARIAHACCTRPGSATTARPCTRSLACMQVLGTGAITKALTVKAAAFSASAKAAIEAAGGSCELVPGPAKWTKKAYKKAVAENPNYAADKLKVKVAKLVAKVSKAISSMGWALCAVTGERGGVCAWRGGAARGAIEELFPRGGVLWRTCECDGFALFSSSSCAQGRVNKNRANKKAAAK